MKTKIIFTISLAFILIGVLFEIFHLEISILTGRVFIGVGLIYGIFGAILLYKRSKK